MKSVMCKNIADILVDPEGALEKRNHWEKTGHSLLTGAILHVLYAEEEKTLASVATFLANPRRTIEATLRIMMTTNHLGTPEAPKVHPEVASIAREMLNKSENELSGVVSTAMSFLEIYRDPIIAKTTSACDWCIDDLKHAEQTGVALSGGAALRYLTHQTANPSDPQSDRAPVDGRTARSKQ